MIGSPWNPFFDQSVPTQYARYDGSLLPGEFEPRSISNQSGGMDLHSLPNYLQVQSDGRAIAVMERTLAMRSEESLSAEVWQNGLPTIWGTKEFTNIFGTMFLWYYSRFSLFSGRMLWQSPIDEDGNRWFFGTAWHHPAAYGFLSDEGSWDGPWLFNGPLREHDNFAGQGQGTTADWNRFYSLWYSDSLPNPTDGSDANFEHPKFTAVTDRGGDTYPVYVPFHRVVPVDDQGARFTVISHPNIADADVRFGMRIRSAIDLNKSNRLQLLTASDATANVVTVSPWYG